MPRKAPRSNAPGPNPSVPPAQESGRSPARGSRQHAAVEHASAAGPPSPQRLRVFMPTGTHRPEPRRASGRFLLPAANRGAFSPHTTPELFARRDWLGKTRYLPSRKCKTSISLHNPIICQLDHQGSGLETTNPSLLPEETAALPSARVHRASKEQHCAPPGEAAGAGRSVGTDPLPGRPRSGQGRQRLRLQHPVSKRPQPPAPLLASSLPIILNQQGCLQRLSLAKSGVASQGCGRRGSEAPAAHAESRRGTQRAEHGAPARQSTVRSLRISARLL